LKKGRTETPGPPLEKKGSFKRNPMMNPMMIPMVIPMMTPDDHPAAAPGS
jgi:hypothetical protein